MNIRKATIKDIEVLIKLRMYYLLADFGFQTIGVFHNVGYKFDEWLNVKWFELRISDNSKPPATTKTINEIRDTEEFRNIIENAVQMIKND